MARKRTLAQLVKEHKATTTAEEELEELRKAARERNSRTSLDDPSDLGLDLPGLRPRRRRRRRST